MEADVTANPLKLRLYAYEGVDDEVIFALGRGRGSDLLAGQELKGQTLVLPAGVPVDIEFKLKDNTDRDLEYCCGDVLWARRGFNCPTLVSNHPALQEHPHGSSHKAILRYDGTEGPFAFALRLIDEKGKHHLFDPIIINDEN